MKRKFLALFLIVILSLSVALVGCGKKDVAEKEVVEEPTKEEVAAEEEVIEEIEDETEEVLDFSGRTMNVVTTSEKYVTLFDKFKEETNASVEFLSMSSGEVLSRMKAEGGKPMADLWFGGGLDAFMQAKTDDLLEPYIPVESADVPAQFKDAEGYWISKGITVVGFLVNHKILEEKGLDIPTTWVELADPKYKGEVIMSSPAVSGTNYAAVKGLLDMFGEEKGWEYITDLNENIPFYGKRGKDPQEKTAAGEFAIGIIPADASSFKVADEADLTVIYPEDGIPWVPEGVAIFKNSENVDIAKAFEEFMLRVDNQKILAELDGKDSAQMIKPGVEGLDLGLPQDKLIDEDLSTFGTMREEILEKWSKIAEGK